MEKDRAKAVNQLVESAGKELWDRPATGAENSQLLTPRQATRILTPADAARYVRSHEPALQRPLIALYLDRGSNLLAAETIELRRDGGWGIKPMRFIAQAQHLGAMGFIIVHDISPGKMRPKGAELEMARELRRLGDELDRYLIHYLILEGDVIREISA